MIFNNGIQIIMMSNSSGENNPKVYFALFTGSISHHHGVGKLRKKWYTDTVSDPGRKLLLATKNALDPDNIFALGNMALGEYTSNGEPILKSKL